MTTQTQIELNNILVELLIQKAFADGFNPAESKSITKSINKIRNEIEKQNPEGSQGNRYSRNFIRQIKSGCEKKCQESNEASDLHP